MLDLIFRISIFFSLMLKCQIQLLIKTKQLINLLIRQK